MNMRSGAVEDRDLFGRRAPIVVAAAAAVSGYLALWLPWRLAMFRGTSGAVVPRYFWIGGIFSMALFPALAISDLVRRVRKLPSTRRAEVR